MRLNTAIGFLLQHTAMLLAKQNEQILQERLGIGLSQYRILRVLQAKSGIRQRDIANILGQTEASVSRQMKLMLDEGLLSSTVSPVSRREHIVRPTAKGAKLTAEALELLHEQNGSYLATLGEEGREQLAELLSKFHDGLCPIVHPTLPPDAHPKKF